MFKLDHNVSYVLKQNTPKIIKNWLIFLITGIIILLIIGTKYEYYKYDTYLGYIKLVEDFKLFIYAKDNEISSLNDKVLIIDKKEYSYEITSISDEYYLVDNSNYYLIELKVNLEDKYLINNNIVNVIIKKNKTTLLKEIGGIIWKN